MRFGLWLAGDGTEEEGLWWEQLAVSVRPSPTQGALWIFVFRNLLCSVPEPGSPGCPYPLCLGSKSPVRDTASQTDVSSNPGSWDFSGGPAVKTPCFHRRGFGFNLWSGNFKIPHATWCGQKVKKKKKSQQILAPLQTGCVVSEPQCPHLYNGLINL